MTVMACRCSPARRHSGGRRQGSLTGGQRIGTVVIVPQLSTLTLRDAGEILTLQRAAYVSEAQAHRDVNLAPLRQSLAELVAELDRPDVIAMGLRATEHWRLIAAASTPTPGR